MEIFISTPVRQDKKICIYMLSVQQPIYFLFKV